MPHSALLSITRVLLWRLIGRIAFNRIRMVGQPLPAAGPVVFVATHRNGALDAAPYAAVAPEAVPIVSAQLHRMPLGRFLFRGIPVSRAKDRERGIEADNFDAVQRCISLLKNGGQLLIMPEGTSTLGPAHLPFHRGAARIVKAAMEAGVVPAIVPLGVHYEDPTVWQSRVEVLVGEAVYPHLEDSLKAIHGCITMGLESVGANFADEEEQRLAEALAYACTLGTSASYARSLKCFEKNIPEAFADIAHALDAISQREQLCLHQGVPLAPIGPWPLYAAYWLCLAPIVFVFCLLNAPVLCAGFAASRKLPDDRNVIAFWRMVAALPAALVWSAAVTATLAGFTGFYGVLAYWGVTVGGVASWYRWRKLSVALHNGLFHAGARPALVDAYEKLMRLLPDDQSA